MSVVFVKSAYNKLQPLSNITSYDSNLNFPKKFALKAFNKLAYNKKISGLFATNLLLKLPKYL